MISRLIQIATNSLDTGTQNIDKVNWRQTADIFNFRYLENY